MSDQSNNLNERTEQLETDMLDVKISLNRLIDVSFENRQQLRDTMQAVDRLAQTQLEFMQRTETVITQLADSQTQTFQRIEAMQGEVREMQSEVRGLQTENRRIWETLSNQQGNNP
jgi:thymidylate kinase